tara:strand:- start:102 stop:449 length:348 start_codon:yes stop_codon:yes gene_type:complete
MPVLKKEFELNDGQKIMVRQASGLEKMKLESIQARVIRKCRHFGDDPSEWTDDQHIEFIELLDENGGGIARQAELWLPSCVLTEEFDANTLTSEELRDILSFVRGDSDEGAIPLA